MITSAVDFETAVSTVHNEGLRIHMLIELADNEVTNGEKWRCIIAPQDSNIDSIGWKGSAKDNPASAIFDAVEGYRTAEQGMPLPAIGAKQSKEEEKQAKDEAELEQSRYDRMRRYYHNKKPPEPKKEQKKQPVQKPKPKPKPKKQRGGRPKIYHGTGKVKGRNADRLVYELTLDLKAGRVPEEVQVQRLPERQKKRLRSAIEEYEKGTSSDSRCKGFMESIIDEGHEREEDDSDSGDDNESEDEDLSSIFGGDEDENDSEDGGGDEDLSSIFGGDDSEESGADEDLSSITGGHDESEGDSSGSGGDEEESLEDLL